MDPCDQAWTPCEGWQDKVLGGDLPILSPHQGARDHCPLPWTCPQGRGFEDHACPEADQGWTANQVQGLRCHRRLQRPRRAWCEVQQGSCHRHPWRHHHGKALDCSCEARLLGHQAWQAPHCSLQGDWKVRQHLGETHPCSSWNWHRLCSCSQEAPPDAGIEDCYTSAKGSTGTLGNFAKATYAAIAETYSYLTPDLWKETVFTKSPYQEFTDFLAKNHRAAGVQKQEARAY